MAEELGGDEPGFSAEEWAELERQFTKEATKKAAYKEPSARQRELTAKWKNAAPTDTGWRTDGPAVADPVRERDDGVRVPAARSGRRLRAPRRIWVRYLLALVVGVGVALLVVYSPKWFGSSGSYFGQAPSVVSVVRAPGNGMQLVADHGR